MHNEAGGFFDVGHQAGNVECTFVVPGQQAWGMQLEIEQAEHLLGKLANAIALAKAYRSATNHQPVWKFVGCAPEPDGFLARKLGRPQPSAIPVANVIPFRGNPARTPSPRPTAPGEVIEIAGGADA